MKRVIIILLFNFCWTCGHSQGNKRIIEICDSLVGKKVLRGYCGDFTYYVLKKLSNNNEIEEYADYFEWKNKYPDDLILYPGDYIHIKRGVKIAESDLFYEVEYKRAHVAFIHHWADVCSVALIHQWEGNPVRIDVVNICKMYKGKMKVMRSYEK